MIYSVDTSTLITAWNERYRIKNFPGFWDHLDRLIENGRVLSPEEVRREIKKKDDGLWKWLDQRRPMFVELEQDIQRAAKAILNDYPYLTKNLASRHVADPFVIALANVRGCQVVTEEAPGNSRKPRIPYVCRELGIECLGLAELIDQEGWQF